MKQSLIQTAKTILCCNSLKKVLGLLLLGLLFFFVLICFQLYPKWNEIPNQTIKANLIAFGDVSDSSCCKFIININAGSYYNNRKDKESTNRMIVWHRFKNPVRYNSDINLLRILKDDSTKLRDKLSDMRSFYVLNYYSSTTINARHLYSNSQHQYDSLCFSYIDKPLPCIESGSISYSGSGFVAFTKSAYKEQELRGKGDLSFNTNLINSKPEMKSLWDITQANYNILIACENISCDTISIDFYGATLFSNMHPEPDKISMSGIEFTKPDKIQEIQKNGLQFHSEFLELKGMAAMRVFILTALLSLLIALIANAITKRLF